MTAVTVNRVGDSQDDDMQPPRGTAIVRPLRYVRAVRVCHARRFANAAEASTSRSARAWGWALGETVTAPVTDRQTVVPPSRSDIETEIDAADERRLRGDRENRADAAAKILRWLIGGDDHVPVRCENPGELVGGFGDIVRAREQIADVMRIAVESQHRESAMARDAAIDTMSRRLAEQAAAYFEGVGVTLAWVLGERTETPITRSPTREVTTRNLKTERIHADDLVEQARHPWLPGRVLPPMYGEGARDTITWLLGGSILLLTDRGSRVSTGW